MNTLVKPNDFELNLLPKSVFPEQEDRKFGNHEFSPLSNGSISPTPIDESCSSEDSENNFREKDHSDEILYFITQLLMEEDVENNPCMLHDCLALQATEESKINREIEHRVSQETEHQHASEEMEHHDNQETEHQHASEEMEHHDDRETEHQHVSEEMGHQAGQETEHQHTYEEIKHQVSQETEHQHASKEMEHHDDQETAHQHASEEMEHHDDQETEHQHASEEMDHQAGQETERQHTYEEMEHEAGQETEHQVDSGRNTLEGTKESGKGRNKTSFSISYEDLQQHLGKKIDDVVKELGVSRSTFKRIIRGHGIKRWPSNAKNKKNPSIFEASNANKHVRSNQQKTLVSSSNTPPCLDQNVLPNTDIIGSSQNHIDLPKTDDVVTIKATFGVDTVKIQFCKSSKMEKFVEEVVRRFNLAVGSFKLKYFDEDDEWMLLACDDDLKLCIKTLTSLGKTPIRVSVQSI